MNDEDSRGLATDTLIESNTANSSANEGAGELALETLNERFIRLTASARDAQLRVSQTLFLFETDESIHQRIQPTLGTHAR